MSKIFDRVFEDTSIKRINEDVWFTMHQKALLWLASTNEGRDLLCISKDFPEIHEIAKNYIKHHDFVPVGKKWRRVTTTDFRIGAKYANIIRYRWEDWLNCLARYDIALYLRQLPQQYVPDYAVVNGVVASVMNTTSTFYPDPDVETTSVDGSVARTGVADTWAGIRDGAGNGSSDNQAEEKGLWLESTAVANTWSRMFRSLWLFDSSSLGDTDTIDSATFSIYVVSTATSFAQSVRFTTSTPASNTALATTDYANVGTTANATDIAVSSLTTGAYNDFALNATGLGNVSKTGVSKFGARLSSDANNVTATWTSLAESFVNPRYAEQTGTASDPKLVVVHSVGVTFVPSIIII